jgi:hypothetical protein
MDYDTSQTTLSGNYTYPLSFKKNYPYIVWAKISVSASNGTGSSILNRNWYLYMYNGSWRTLVTFTMPSNGEYVWEGSIGYSSCQKFAAVPNSQMSSGTTWTLGLSVEEMTIQETVTTADLSSDYISGLFTNQSGAQLKPCQVHVNMGGTVTKATKVLCNVDGTLKELPPAYNGSYTTTTPESMRVYEFTPPSTGDYYIEIKINSGDHEARMYNSSFARVHPSGSTGNTDTSYFYSGTFTLTGGSLYYISLIHYHSNTNTSDSVLLVTKI